MSDRVPQWLGMPLVPGLHIAAVLARVNGAHEKAGPMGPAFPFFLPGKALMRRLAVVETARGCPDNVGQTTPYVAWQSNPEWLGDGTAIQ